MPEAVGIAWAQAQHSGTGSAQLRLGSVDIDVDIKRETNEHAVHAMNVRWRLRLTIDEVEAGGPAQATVLLAAAERGLVDALAPALRRQKLGILLDVSMPGRDDHALHHRAQSGYRFAQYVIWKEMRMEASA